MTERTNLMVPVRGTSSRVPLNLLIDFHTKSPLFAKLTPDACRDTGHEVREEASAMRA